MREIKEAKKEEQKDIPPIDDVTLTYDIRVEDMSS